MANITQILLVASLVSWKQQAAKGLTQVSSAHQVSKPGFTEFCHRFEVGKCVVLECN